LGTGETLPAIMQTQSSGSAAVGSEWQHSHTHR